jgi:ferric-dicitrate binding protein FerR (iron transport regulator)
MVTRPVRRRPLPHQGQAPSAATVVGTKWLVDDRCRSTLTKVARGKVKVSDFARRKTVVVKAGRTYVAR